MEHGCPNCRPSFTCAACLRVGTPGQLNLDQALRDDEKDCDPGDCSDHKR